MASNALIERHIVAYGNYPLAAGGQDLFSCPVNTGRKIKQKIFYNGSPGQLVAYTYDVNTSTVPVTVDPGDIATLTTDLYVGVFVDLDNDGVADDVKLLAGEKFDKCNVLQASVGTPACGQPVVEAATADCVECNTTYQAKVTIDKSTTRSWGPWNKTGAEIMGTYTPECNGCDTCPSTVDPKEVICGLVDSLNDEIEVKIMDRLYPDWKQRGSDKMYRVVRGHDNWYTYCLTPDAADCNGDCNTIAGIKQVVVDEGGGNEATTVFSGNLNAADPTKTDLGMVKNIAQQIELAIEAALGPHTGFAVVTQGATSCCAMQLHVITCDANFRLDDVTDTEITPCTSAVDTAFTFPTEWTCADCGDSAPADYTPPAWMAVIAEPEAPECGHYLDKPKAFYGVTAKIEFIKDANDYAPIVKTKTLLESITPRNMGSWIQFLEYHHGLQGGRGRNNRDGNYRRGWAGLPDKTSKINVPDAKCGSMYCSYFMDHERVYKNEIASNYEVVRFHSGIHVDTNDDVTLTDAEALFDALITANNNNCKVIGTASCYETVTVEVNGGTAQLELATGGATSQLTAVVTPLNVSQDVVWSIEADASSALASLDANGLVTTHASNTGLATIRATSVYDPLVYDEMLINVT